MENTNHTAVLTSVSTVASSTNASSFGPQIPPTGFASNSGCVASRLVGGGPPPTLNVEIAAGSRLTYQNKLKNKESSLQLADPFAIIIPHGYPVRIDTTHFFVVAQFVQYLCGIVSSTPMISDEVSDINERAKAWFDKKVTLPMGTKVTMSNGLTVNLAADLEVSIPPQCKIRLPAQTKLQLQHQPQAHLILDNACNVNLNA